MKRPEIAYRNHGNATATTTALIAVMKRTVRPLPAPACSSSAPILSNAFTNRTSVTASLTAMTDLMNWAVPAWLPTNAKTPNFSAPRHASASPKTGIATAPRTARTTLTSQIRAVISPAPPTTSSVTTRSASGITLPVIKKTTAETGPTRWQLAAKIQHRPLVLRENGRALMNPRTILPFASTNPRSAMMTSTVPTELTKV